MTVPVLKLGSILIASVPSDATDEQLMGLQSTLVDRIGRLRSAKVVIDVTVVDLLDSFATRVLRSTADMARLRGAEAVIVGIQPGVALAMVQLGLTLDRVGTAFDLEEALAGFGIYVAELSP